MTTNTTHKLPVTTALRQIIKEVNPEVFYGNVFSDPRTPKPGVKAVGVKFNGIQLNEHQIGQVVEKMKERGYTFYYYKWNEDTPMQFYNGLRFCFGM